MILARRSYGLPAAMLRHLIVLGVAAGAVAIEGVTLAQPINERFGSWVLVAIGIGVLCALIARGVLGVVFVVAGVSIGILVIFAVQTGAAANLSATLPTTGTLYLEIVVVAAIAYLATAIVLSWLTSALSRTRRRDTRPRSERSQI